MLICPQDCHICDLQDCRTAGCERTGELPLAECVECGAVFVRGAFGRTVRFAACADCTASSRAVARSKE